MDCKIPFIYIAETQRSRMIMSKTRSIAICHQTNTETPLEYLGRYMHQIAPDTGIVLHSKLFHILCITVIYSRYINL
jgi:hypothetical protein